MALLEVSGLQVTFGGATALRNVSLTMAEGESVAVLGANGAGKSTLLRALMGRVPVASGRVVFDGDAITGMATDRLVRRGMSLCPEGRQLFPSMSVEDNLLLGAHLATRQQAGRRLASIYARFPLLRRRRRELAGAFSGGEQQLIAIARALMASPRLLLMDEPSSGLSPVAIARVKEILQDVRESGTLILLVDQNVQLAVDISDRCYVLSRGLIQAQGPSDSLTGQTSLADAYLGGMASAGEAGAGGR